MESSTELHKKDDVIDSTTDEKNDAPIDKQKIDKINEDEDSPVVDSQSSSLPKLPTSDSKSLSIAAVIQNKNEDEASESSVNNIIKESQEEASTSLVSKEPEQFGEEGSTTTVQFIAVSAEEHMRMVQAGELPESVHGADVHMQIPGADAQQVRLIAVDSNGVPVTETAILQAAAEQAGIVFLTKDANNMDSQITIDQAMRLSMSKNAPSITATTAAVVLEQPEAEHQFDTDGNETEDDNMDDNKKRVKKQRLKLRVYSQKDALDNEQLTFLHEGSSLSLADESLGGTVIEDKQNDESVYEFQDPPTGGDVTGELEVLDPSIFKKIGKKVDKNRDRRKIYQCRDCAFYSHRHSNLIRHIKIHTNERPYKCHLCDRAFRTNTLLRNHINTHTGVKPYKCQVEGCIMAFVTSGELTRHTRYIHTHEKPFQCTMCDYASVEISKLRRHFRSHTGERPYPCDDCGKAFADSFHLKRHKMSHTGEKPYECPECNQRFTQRGSVKMHIMQQHTKTAPRFKCEICQTLLGRKSDLNVHMRNQHAFQETPTQCRYCDELFHDRWSLMQHQRTHRSCGARFKNELILPRKKRRLADEDYNEIGWKETNPDNQEFENLILEEEDGDLQRVTVYVEEEDQNSSQHLEQQLAILSKEDQNTVDEDTEENLAAAQTTDVLVET